MSDAIKKMIEFIVSECVPEDMDQRYDEMLDECSESCATCKMYGASRILKEMDPVAYRCGFNDWIDGELKETVVTLDDDSVYYDKTEATDAWDEHCCELEQELADTESELEDMQNADNHEDNDDIQHVKDKISQLTEQIKECRAYDSFN